MAINNGLCPCTYFRKIKNLYLSNNKRLLFIQPGLTSVFQPLDVSINKLFKDGIRNKYAEYLIKNKDIPNKVNREDIIKWIADVWYSDKIISKISIIIHLRLVVFWIISIKTMIILTRLLLELKH